MADKLINVTEYGSNRKLTIMISNILFTEYLKYNSGPEVTVITLVGNKEIHVTESLIEVNNIINR